MAVYLHPHGTIFADPGLQKDKKPRYPTDTKEKARAALDYIGMPRNSSKYSAEALKTVRANIIRAARHYGIKPKSVSTIMTADATIVKPKILPPDSTSTHFFTAGRMITYNEPNLNGLVFFKDDCHPVIETLNHSLADISHVKPGNGVPVSDGQTNKVIGSIFEVHEDDEGIDIICKNDRDAAQGMGFTEEDFKPLEGLYSCFSQESDFTPSTSLIMAVAPGILHNIDPDKDIVYEMSSDEAKARNLSTSYFDARTGKWIYNKDEDGNTLFIRLRPLSFSGVGHVIDPADENAQIYSYAASVEGEKVIGELYPRSSSDTYPSLDDPGYMPPGPGMGGGGGGGDGDTFDQGGGGDDFRRHPDLSSTTKDYFNKPDDDKDFSDECYAALYYAPNDNDEDDKSRDPTQPLSLSDFGKRRLFRVKDKTGNFDRSRLIAAYHVMTGMRGHTAMASMLPGPVRQHALAVIRQGLDKTNPKERQMSDIQQVNPALEQDIVALQERATALVKEKETATESYQSLSSEYTSYKETNTALLAEKQTEIDLLKEQLAEINNKALSTSRYAALEEIHPYSDAEKADEKFGEFQTSLATISEDRFDYLKLRRELEKSKSENDSLKSLSSYNGALRLSPAPQFEGQTQEKPSMKDIL